MIDIDIGDMIDLEEGVFLLSTLFSLFSLEAVFFKVTEYFTIFWCMDLAIHNTGW